MIEKKNNKMTKALEDKASNTKVALKETLEHVISKW